MGYGTIIDFNEKKEFDRSCEELQPAVIEMECRAEYEDNALERRERPL